MRHIHYVPRRDHRTAQELIQFARQPGPVVTTLSTSQAVADAARANGCPVILTPVGEVHVVEKMLEVVEAFEQATGRPVPHRIVGRRAGDAPAVFADPAKAQRELGWTAELDLNAMCRDAFNWQQKNPRGYL